MNKPTLVDNVNIELSALINHIQNELIESEKVRIREGRMPLFKTESMDIEINFVLKQASGTGGKIDLKLIALGASQDYSSELVHKVRMTFKSIDSDEIVGEPDNVQQAYHPRGVYPSKVSRK